MATEVVHDTIHCVGTMNYPSVREAMEDFLNAAGDRAFYVPIEAGARSRWIIPNLEDMRVNQALKVVKPGNLKVGPSFMPLSEYLTLPWYKVRKGHSFDIDLHYAGHAREAWEIFKDLEVNSRVPLRMQVGLADPMQLPLFTNLMDQYYVFEQAVVSEARRIHAMVEKDGGTVTFQLDMPAQTVMVNLAGRVNKRWQQKLISDYAAKYRAYLEQFPEGARVAVHLCYGHKDDESILHPSSAQSTVELANALSWATPLNVHLEYVHLPLATPKIKPSTKLSYYQALANLKFRDPQTLLAAGFAHKLVDPADDIAMNDQRVVLEMVRRLFDGNLMVSGICGFGEDAPGVMLDVLQQQYELLD